MSFRKRLLFFLLILLVLAGLDALCAPPLMVWGLRFWIERTAQQHHLEVSIGEITAPFLGELTLRDLRLTSGRGAASETSFRAAFITLDLNIRGWLFSRRAHLLRSLEVGHAVGHLTVPARAVAPPNADWRLLSQLLPDNFRCDHFDFDVTTAATAFRLRDAVLTASAIESGKFLAQEISIESPVLRRSFINLRGATSWEAQRLTIAGIPLVHGLDLEALTLDLSHLSRRRIGIDLHLDTFGGELRASFQGKAGEKFVVDVAGSAANISLTQFSQAVGFIEPITGAVRASKFTFRGNPGEFLDATASIWMELTDFAWRARRADSVMLGATYYGRRLEVDQLYVRQLHNELTASGELLWPEKTRSRSRPPFRGQLNASIPDLNDFAQFFGATTGDFSGALFAEGAVDSLAPEAHGQLKVRGEAVKYRGVALDSLGASCQLKGTETTIENFEMRHAQDFVRAQGTFDLAANHRFAGRLTGAINDLGDYAALLPKPWRSSKIAGGVTFDWRGDGTTAASSGTMQIFAHGLQLPVTALRQPLDLTLEGTYSPQEVFFRTFKLANDRISLGAFVLLGSNFVEIQALDLSLDGLSRASGTLFFPFGLERWRSGGSLFAALDEKQKFDVDLVVDHLDLAALASALGETSAASGILNGKLAAFGPLPSLQVTTNWRLENAGAASARNAIDFHGHYAESRADVDANATFGVSDPVTLRASLPLRVSKTWLAQRDVLDPAKPLSLDLSCPALFLETLPNEWNWGADRGLVSGAISFSGKAQAPEISGDAQILDAHLKPPPLWPDLSHLNAEVRFASKEAALDPIRFQVDAKPVSLRGRLTTTPSSFALSLRPSADTITVAGPLPRDRDLATIRVLEAGAGTGEARLREAIVRGGPASTSLTIVSENDRSWPRQTTYFFDSPAAAASPLWLRIIPLESPVFELQREKPAPAFR